MPSQTRTVTLDVNATPPVTILGGDIVLNSGEEAEIEWSPAEGESGWTFSKITLSDQVTSLPDPPFSDVSVSDDEISVKDDNTSSVDNGTWNYSICVVQGTTEYWSDPEIINKSGG